MIGFQLRKLLRIFLTKTIKDLFVCGVYIPPHNSNYFDPKLFEDLESDIENYSSQGSVLLLGDLNSKTGNTQTMSPKKEIIF